MLLLPAIFVPQIVDLTPALSKGEGVAALGF